MPSTNVHVYHKGHILSRVSYIIRKLQWLLSDFFHKNSYSWIKRDQLIEYKYIYQTLNTCLLEGETWQWCWNGSSTVAISRWHVHGTKLHVTVNCWQKPRYNTITDNSRVTAQQLYKHALLCRLFWICAQNYAFQSLFILDGLWC